MPTTPNYISKQFIAFADDLIEKGVVGSDKEIVDAIDWHKSSMSQVRNGRQNIPIEVYRKFVSYYKLKKTEPDEVAEDLRDRLIETLQEQNKFLKDQLNSVTGQLRHVLLLTSSMVETNQDSLAQIMEKQKIGSVSEVTERHRKANLASYSKMKADLGIV